MKLIDEFINSTYNTRIKNDCSKKEFHQASVDIVTKQGYLPSTFKNLKISLWEKLRPDCCRMSKSKNYKKYLRAK